MIEGWRYYAAGMQNSVFRSDKHFCAEIFPTGVWVVSVHKYHTQFFEINACLRDKRLSNYHENTEKFSLLHEKLLKNIENYLTIAIN